MGCTVDTFIIGEDKAVLFRWLDSDGVTYLDLDGYTTRTASIAKASDLVKIYTVNGVLSVDKKSIVFTFDGPTQTANLEADKEYIIEILLAGTGDKKFQFSTIPTPCLEA